MQKDIVPEIEALKATGRFDAEWYLATYPDASLLGMDAYEHYVKVGRRLGRPMQSGDDQSPRQAAVVQTGQVQTVARKRPSAAEIETEILSLD
jgi:hypothetical protein